jgi:hypothetical protein
LSNCKISHLPNEQECRRRRIERKNEEGIEVCNGKKTKRNSPNQRLEL